jgi:hypothetical protein
LANQKGRKRDEMNKLNLSNQRYGQLIALYETPYRGDDRSIKWFCLCDCGNTIIVSSNSLRQNLTKSCGCLQKQHQKFGSIKHGHTINNIFSKTYITWANMIRRCSDPKVENYKNYGGRGIKVCERWFQFKNFLEDMGDKPNGLVLDRKENDGNYEPSNCRWVDYSTSNKNRRIFRKRKEK